MIRRWSVLQPSFPLLSEWKLISHELCIPPTAIIAAEYIFICCYHYSASRHLTAWPDSARIRRILLPAPGSYPERFNNQSAKCSTISSLLIFCAVVFAQHWFRVDFSRTWIPTALFVLLISTLENQAIYRRPFENFSAQRTVHTIGFEWRLRFGGRTRTYCRMGPITDQIFVALVVMTLLRSCDRGPAIKYFWKHGIFQGIRKTMKNSGACGIHFLLTICLLISFIRCCLQRIIALSGYQTRTF